MFMSLEPLKIEQYTPVDALKPYVKTLMIIESDKQTATRLLPDTSIALAFRLKGRVTDLSHDASSNLSSSVVTGLRRSVRFLSYDDQTANLLVIFRQGGAVSFFKEPLHEFFGKSTPLAEFIPPSQLRLVEEQLYEAGNNRQKVTVVERFLLSRLNQKRADQLVNHAMQQIRLANGSLRISKLAASMAISIDPFEKRFRRVAGISPKQFAHTIRLRNLIKQYSASENLTGIALEAGYFDQAHFIKDFRIFTGLAPQQFFRLADWW
jgi:AraC-like DNA-binding protein